MLTNSVVSVQNVVCVYTFMERPGGGEKERE